MIDFQLVSFRLRCFFISFQRRRLDSKYFLFLSFQLGTYYTYFCTFTYTYYICLQYLTIYLYLLPILVTFTYTYTDYLYLYVLPILIRSTYTCNLYLYLVPLPVLGVFTCTCYLYLLHIRILATYTYTCYVYLYLLPIRILATYSYAYYLYFSYFKVIFLMGNSRPFSLYLRLICVQLRAQCRKTIYHVWMLIFVWSLCIVNCYRSNLEVKFITQIRWSSVQAWPELSRRKECIVIVKWHKKIKLKRFLVCCRKCRTCFHFHSTCGFSFLSFSCQSPDNNISEKQEGWRPWKSSPCWIKYLTIVVDTRMLQWAQSWNDSFKTCYYGWCPLFEDSKVEVILTNLGTVHPNLKISVNTNLGAPL